MEERQNGVEKIDCTRLWVEGYLAKKLVGSGGATEMVVCVYQGKYLLFGKIALKNLRKEIEKRKALDCETGWSTFSVC